MATFPTPIHPSEKRRPKYGNVGFIRFALSGAAPGKPRMTQRDKWKKRPCVVAYREWSDRLRAAAPVLPLAANVTLLTVTATYAPPESWSARKRAASIGNFKRSVPDGDNIAKAVADTLWEQDAALGDTFVRRRWGERDGIEIEIEAVAELIEAEQCLQQKGRVTP